MRSEHNVLCAVVCRAVGVEIEVHPIIGGKLSKDIKHFGLFVPD